MGMRVLGKDYVLLQGKGDREVYNGATVKGDTHTHLGLSSEQVTVCGRAIDKFFLTYDDVEIDCPECIAELKRRGGNQ